MQQQDVLGPSRIGHVKGTRLVELQDLVRVPVRPGDFGRSKSVIKAVGVRHTRFLSREDSKTHHRTQMPSINQV